MKVYIGPHKSWFGPFQLSEALCFWAKKVEDEYGMKRKPDWVHNFGEWLSKTWISKLLYWIDSKRKRNVKIRIDPYDTWNMDATLSMIVLPMLKQLKDTTHGSAMVDDADVPEHLRSTAAPPKENEWDTDENVHLRWTWILDEMIWTFEQLQPDYDWHTQYEKGKAEFVFDLCEETYTHKNGKIEKLYEMKPGPNHTLETDYEGIEKHQQRINNGLRLFGRYYQGLWD